MLKARANEIEVSAKSSEEGEGNEVCPADYSGEEVTLGFNARYIQEFLNIAATGTEIEQPDGEEGDTKNIRISIEFEDQTKAVQFRIENQADIDYRYIVMPLRV